MRRAPILAPTAGSAAANSSSRPRHSISRPSISRRTCAIADKGDKGEKHGHGKKHEYHDDDRRHEYRREDYPRYDDRRDDISIQLYFGNNDRRIINEYYAPEFRAGHCPPGLAKKGNGCMPPGQAKKGRC